MHEPVAPWEVMCYSTRTGAVALTGIPFDGMPDAASRLNTEGSLQVRVPMTRTFGHREITPFLDYWRWSYLLCRGSHIWQAGPLVHREYDAIAEVWTLTCAGPWKLLSDKRLVIDPSTWDGSSFTNGSGDLSLGPATKANLARSLLNLTLQLPGGDLPLDIPADTGPGTHSRSFELAKLPTVGDALRALTAEEDGPELEFSPYFTDPVRRDSVRHLMRAGNPHLGQLGTAWQWTGGLALEEFSPAGNGDRVADHYLVPGASPDSTTPAPIGASLHAGPGSLHEAGFPLMFSVNPGYTGVTDAEQLDSIAVRDHDTYRLGTAEYTAVVRIDGHGPGGEPTLSPSLDRVSNGDTGIFAVAGYAGIPDGEYRCRVLGRRPLSEDSAELELQLLSTVATDPIPGVPRRMVDDADLIRDLYRQMAALRERTA